MAHRFIVYVFVFCKWTETSWYIQYLLNLDIDFIFSDAEKVLYYFM